MLAEDEDAVICDLAETYHIYEMRSLPLDMVATFVCGLGQNSRIKRKLSNEEYTTTDLLLMNIADSLSILVWQNTEDGVKGRNKPKLFAESLGKQKNEKSLGFSSKEEFELMRQAILRS